MHKHSTSLFHSISKRNQKSSYLLPVSIGFCCLCLYFIVFYCIFGSNDTNYHHTNATDSSISNPTNRQIRIICISDTHNGYKTLTQQLIDLYQSDDDVLIHAGDMTHQGSRNELEQINEWFATLPYKHKIAISGNMDGIGLDTKNIDGHKIFTNAKYLEHETYEIQEIGLKLFASPYTPQFVGGFQLMSEEEAADKWIDIPADIDLLVTHGPPYNILDQTSRGTSIGDKPLMHKIRNIKKLKAVIFGHVHASFGHTKQDGIQYVNAAMYNGIYSDDTAIKPVVMTLDL